MSRFMTRPLILVPFAMLLMAAFALALLVETIGDLAAGFGRSEKAS